MKWEADTLSLCPKLCVSLMMMYDALKWASEAFLGDGAPRMGMEGRCVRGKCHTGRCIGRRCDCGGLWNMIEVKYAYDLD